MPFAQALNDLRQDIDRGTHALAKTKLLNPNAFNFLYEKLHAGATAANEALQQEGEPQRLDSNSINNSLQSMYQYDVVEVVRIAPVIVLDTALQAKNDFIFSIPFQVLPFDPQNAPSERHMLFTCAVGAFNLALTLHNKSYMVEGEQRKTMLREANDMYRHAFSLLEGYDLDPHETLIHLYMAICNNLAELLTDLGDVAKAAEWKELLHASFLPIPPDYASPVYRHFWNLVQKYGFFVIPDNHGYDDEDLNDDDDDNDEDFE